MSSIVHFILESNIEDFVQSLKHQNILLEVDDFGNRNGTDALSYNGAIIVSGKQKVCFASWFLLLWLKKRMRKSLIVFKTLESQPRPYKQPDSKEHFGRHPGAAG